MIKINESQDFLEDTKPAASVPSTKRKSKRNFSTNLNIILLIAVAVLSYGYYTKQQELVLIKNPEIQAEVARKEAEDVIAMIKKIAVLPAGEEFPEVLTINDAKLAVKEQPALEGVIDGDKVLLYYDAGKAYIYSPSRNIVVNILPFTQQKTTDTTAPAPTTPKPTPAPAPETTTSSSSARAVVDEDDN